MLIMMQLPPMWQTASLPALRTCRLTVWSLSTIMLGYFLQKHCQFLTGSTGESVVTQPCQCETERTGLYHTSSAISSWACWAGGWKERQQGKAKKEVGCTSEYSKRREGGCNETRVHLEAKLGFRTLCSRLPEGLVEWNNSTFVDPQLFQWGKFVLSYRCKSTANCSVQFSCESFKAIHPAATPFSSIQCLFGTFERVLSMLTYH